MKESNRDIVNVPNLRFPEFDGKWMEKRLGSIATFSKGKGISKSDIASDGILECIRYGQLYTDYSEVINKIISKTNIDKDNLVLSRAGDVIIPASGETQIDIATASCVINSGIALGSDLNIIKTIMNGVFLSYYLNYTKKLDIAKLSQGISVVHLYASQLKTLKLNVPIQKEQKKITSFLVLIDKRISTQIKIIEHQESLKEGLTQKMFSQKILFKNKYGNDFKVLEYKQLKDICEKRSSNISANSLKRNVGNYKIYGANGYFQDVNFYQEDREYISIVKDGAGVGRTLLCEAKTSVLGTLDKIKPKKNTNLYFLFLLLNSIKFKKYIVGSTIPHIYFKDYQNERIKLPCLEEQAKIADFLSAIDKKLEKEKQILEQYKQQKKYLLQNLFI
ncbi:MAG: restriction endonuclease subunit S [Polaribacter sp.]|uniref:restriction endonuclease subunit S n=1 Tax=Polaribacter sp. TaxID=1920175 RepID=UPI002F34FFEB